MSSVGTVRVWHRELGWGVIDAPDTPGGCWVHFSHLWDEEKPTAGPQEAISGDYVELFGGETVDFTWRHPGQDGYDYAATAVRPRDRPVPNRWVVPLVTADDTDPGKRGG